MQRPTTERPASGGRISAQPKAFRPAVAAPPAAPQKPSAPVSKSVQEDLRASVEDANKRLLVSNQQMTIAIDQQTGAIVVTVTDRKTGETVRQIPSEDALKLRRSLDSLTGILVDQKG